MPAAVTGRDTRAMSVALTRRSHRVTKPPARLQQRLLSTDAGGCKLHAPDGMVQLAPQAGDFVIMSEMTSHCILPWQPTNRSRQALTLRFYSGKAREARGGGINEDLEEWIEHVAPLTRTLLQGAPLAAARAAAAL